MVLKKEDVKTIDCFNNGESRTVVKITMFDETEYTAGLMHLTPAEVLDNFDSYSWKII